MTISTDRASIKSGDVLILETDGGEVTLDLSSNTTADQVVIVGGQKFNLTIDDDETPPPVFELFTVNTGTISTPINQILTITSVNDASSGTTVDAGEAASVAEFDAVLDALKFNNTVNDAPVIGAREFEVSLCLTGKLQQLTSNNDNNRCCHKRFTYWRNILAKFC